MNEKIECNHNWYRYREPLRYSIRVGDSYVPRIIFVKKCKKCGIWDEIPKAERTQTQKRIVNFYIKYRQKRFWSIY